MEDDSHANHFYERRWPEVDELVMARIDEIDETGSRCSLSEYNYLEAYLPSTELSRKRIRSIHHVVQVGTFKIFQVLRVDKGYVDLTKKHVTKEQTAIGKDKYEKGKGVLGIMRRLAETTHTPFKTICEDLMYPLYRVRDDSDDEEDSEEHEKLHPYHLLKKWVFDGADIFGQYDIRITDEIKLELESIIRQRMVTKDVETGVVVEVTCFTHEGIDAIKRVLNSVKKEHPEVAINYIAAPEYRLAMWGADPGACEAVLKQVVDKIASGMKEVGGTCGLKSTNRFQELNPMM